MKVAIVNPVWDSRAQTPAGTLDRFRTLTGWADAIRSAGASEVRVFQRFHDAGEQDRNTIGYRFIADRGRPKPSPLWSGRPLCDAVAAFAPDLVHVNGLDCPRLTRSLRRCLPSTAAIVVQDHGGFDPTALSVWRKSWMRRGLAAADALLVATPPQAVAFAASGLVPPALKVRDVMEASTTLRVGIAAPSRRDLSLLFVGRLNANKDPLTVLQGFATFVRHRPDARLSFVYDDADLEPALRSQVTVDPALAARVTLVGAVRHEDLADVFAKADLFVLGSHREGSGYAVLEALACGVIPVLTDIPSFRGMTGDGLIGALWRPGDPGSLCEALVRLTSSDLRPQREAARAHFEVHFSWEAIGRRALSIYREFSRT